MGWRAIATSVIVGLATACGDDGATPAGDSTGGPTSETGVDSGVDGSTTQAMPACAPVGDGGAGLAYVGEPEAGVRCADEVCPLGCDLRNSPSCNPEAEADDYGSDVLCDGPEDCAEGEVCCVSEIGDTATRSSSVCASSAECPDGARWGCSSDADCGGEHCVRAYTNSGAIDIGACQAEPPSACMPMPGSDCSGASLRGTDLDGENLRDANLCQADLADATLRMAQLDGIVLSDAILTRASLDRASLRAADLSGADLRNAIFHGADLTGADLTGAQLDGALGGNTICPDGTLSSLTQTSLCEGKLDP